VNGFVLFKTVLSPRDFISITQDELFWIRPVPPDHSCETMSRSRDSDSGDRRPRPLDSRQRFFRSPYRSKILFPPLLIPCFCLRGMTPGSDPPIEYSYIAGSRFHFETFLQFLRVPRIFGSIPRFLSPPPSYRAWCLSDSLFCRSLSPLILLFRISYLGVPVFLTGVPRPQQEGPHRRT